MEWAQKTLMRNVYGWMTMALVITGMMAYYMGTNPDLVLTIFSNSVLFWGLFIAEIALVMILSARIDKMSFATAGILFGVYSLLNGVVMGSIFLVYTLESIASTFFITAGMFAVMALIGTVIKKDLSGMGRFLLMALVGLIIASVVNWFMQSSTLYWITSGVGVLLFTGLTVYDAQKIKRMFAEVDDVNDSVRKYALLGALSLYLDFINLFLYLLRFLGNRRS
ncbi:MAG: Bax inhibitor-1/YccA family protein [Paludibacteraceae bacterium]|nr:Bax inhibitor-1/YccA family protein [Paludibacteraceae bacterium]